MSTTVVPIKGVNSTPGAFSIDVWDHLDRFLNQMQLTTNVDFQLNASMEMIRGTICADQVVIYSTTEAKSLASCGIPERQTPKTPLIIQELTKSLKGGEGQVLIPRVVTDIQDPQKPTSAILVRLSRSRGVWIVAFRYSDSPFDQRDLKGVLFARRMLMQLQQQQQAQGQIIDVLFGLVRCLASSLDARDPYTWGHSERVARIAVRLAEEMRLSETIRSEIYLGGLLHDIGKIGVPDEILRKPDRLTDEEFNLVKEHVVIGDNIIKHVRHLAHLSPIVRNHHEQFDGRGYPDRLSGTGIPLMARIVAVADSVDAMLSNRPYRSAMPSEAVDSILKRGAHSQWDPDIIAAYFTCRNDILAIGERGVGDSILKAIEIAVCPDERIATLRKSFFGMKPPIPTT